jgi:hypothetical protein
MTAKRALGVAILTTGLALTLGGCRYYWFKPGSTADMFGRDSEACLADARAASPTTQKYGVVNEQVYRACLASRGYERQKTTSGPDKHRGYEFDD